LGKTGVAYIAGECIDKNKEAPQTCSDIFMNKNVQIAACSMN
jgi:hypothetical protein